MGDLDTRPDDEPTAVLSIDFKEYAQDLAEELGMLKSDNTWPYTCIDWQRAADELEHDYTIFEYDGDDYFTRA